MYYTVYKITNRINGKIYIGSHKTKDLNDNYMGSGKYLKYSQEKHGIENFTKEILFVFDTPELMYAKEAEIVNDEFLAEENTYNLKLGGYGGFDYLNAWKENPTHSADHYLKMSLRLKEKYPNSPMYGRKHSEDSKSKNSQSNLGNQRFLGRKHSDETKQKMRYSALEKHSKDKNSQFGTMWITDGLENKKINKLHEIPDGWRRGRVIN
jgi:group I intron endonuclease